MWIFIVELKINAAMVTGVMVEQLTTNSVRVSWDEIPVDGITYRVYYSQTGNRKRQSTEMSMDSTTNSVDIDGLDSNVEYQFQVVAVVVITYYMGERSFLDDDSILVMTTISTTLPDSIGKEFLLFFMYMYAIKFFHCYFCVDSNRNITIAVLVTFFLTLLLYSTVLLVGCGIYYKTNTNSKR